MSAIAVRREAELVARFVHWLIARGHSVVRHRIPLPVRGYLFTDGFATTAQELIKAKASPPRFYGRTGLGQLLDHGLFVTHQAKSLSCPTRPATDMVELLGLYDVGIIWPAGTEFVRAEGTSIGA